MAFSFRENWRVVVLAVLLLASLVGLFVPGAAPIGGSSATAVNASQTHGPTNLKYGLQLSGGTKVRAPIVGLTATNVKLPTDQQAQRQLATTIAGDLPNVGIADVRLRAYSNGGDTVEVFANVTRAQFVSALDDAGLQVSPGDVRDGVTAATRTEIVGTLTQKVNSLGFSGSKVTVQSTPQGKHYVVVEVPNANISEVRDLVTGRGQITVLAYHPPNGNYSRQVNDTVLTRSDFRVVSEPQFQRGSPGVPVTLYSDAAKRFAGDMQKYGFTHEPGINNCAYPNATDANGKGEYCLLNVRDGKVVYSAGMSQGLATEINNGAFEKRQTFFLQTTSMAQARQVAVDLRAGALAAPLDLQHGTIYNISASSAERFKPLSFVTGLIAAVVVSLVVYVRYGELRIALPMLLTALSEVVILLGFSAFVGLALNLSYIAGFVAVIGTGVDDLVIIADEVTTESVSSARVFQSRFRKAFWIIGGAAATTIIAMTPLTVLSLGDLRGFALITILGVLVGVLLTRPAYGDVLRYLMTGDR